MVHNWGYVKEGPTIVEFRKVSFASNAEIKHSLLSTYPKLHLFLILEEYDQYQGDRNFIFS